ncbi:MAG: pyruvate:ferredoxin (flavodoxin) oxidoreductase, partial [Bdellovibrionales bacterium GWB1_52_6]
RVIGGRYGLSSKEFTPAMVKSIFDELKQPKSKNHFTIGILDDVTHTSLTYDASFSTEHPKTVRALFYGLGADGTVGANKNSIKIIGEDTDNFAQGYFVYDSKKSGSITTSHLRFGPSRIQSSYLISRANFVACHQFMFLERIDMLRFAEEGAVFLLNSAYGKDQVWNELPNKVQKQIIDKKLKFYVIDGYKVAKETGMGGRVNTIMQTCFFAISGVLAKDEAIKAIKKSIEKTYGKRGEQVVQKNYEAVDASLANLHQVTVPATATSKKEVRAAVPHQAPAFVKNVLGSMILGTGDNLPVSAMPIDGTYPVGTAKWEKRNIALEIPEWDEKLCIQCGKCVLVCPHAVIRGKVYDAGLLKDAPSAFKSVDAKWKNFPGQKYSLQVAPEDCTGCALCIEACPSKSKTDPAHKAINMVDQPSIREREVRNWDFFLELPEVDRTALNTTQVKDVQLMQPLFEFSGACGGCGETPYIKLITQLYGDRMILANATGCSSIYGGNLPTTPYTTNKQGRGIAWANSLFEDNAEFGMGIRISQDKREEFARELLVRLGNQIPEQLVQGLLNASQNDEVGVREQRVRVEELKKKLATLKTPEARDLLTLADNLLKKSVWVVGGDGWAYDIGYGGLDHLLASGRNVNILVLDTEVYSNTGGQASKSTPTAAVAKFAASGKNRPKKDLGMMAIQYGNAYVARVAMGFNDGHTVKVFREAEAFDGPSLIIAYSHCIAHGYDLVHGLDQQKLAVQSGHWPLYRYNPTLVNEGKNPFILDSKAPSIPLENYIYNETRYTMLKQAHPEAAAELLKYAQSQVKDRWTSYEYLAAKAGQGTGGTTENNE